MKPENDSGMLKRPPRDHFSSPLNACLGWLVKDARTGPVPPTPHRLLAAGLSGAVGRRQAGGYTAVHTVLTVNSASVAMMSVGWMLRSYMGFSNVARTFVFSWPA